MKTVVRTVGLAALLFAFLFPPLVPVAHAQGAGSVTGLITDASTGEFLGATRVLIEGTQLDATSNNYGRYSITNVPAGTYTVVVERLGYVDGRTSVTVSTGAAVVDIALEVSALFLDELVVTATGVLTTQKAVPTTVTVIDNELIQERAVTQLGQLLRGEVPGAIALNTAANWYGQAEVYMRGDVSTGWGQQGVTTYIDGIEMVNSMFVAWLNNIDPQSIERVEIIPGPQASTIYGANAASGIIQIFTKRGAPGADLVRMNLQAATGIIEGPWNSTIAPRYDASLGVQGSSSDGRLSYGATVSRTHEGAWFREYFQDVNSGAASVRLHEGPLTADLNVRGFQRMSSRGQAQYFNVRYLTGEFDPGNGRGLVPIVNGDYEQSGNTIGFNLTYAPTSWWTHKLTLGRDHAEDLRAPTNRRFTTVSDTGFGYWSDPYTRSSVAYNTTVDRALSDNVRSVLTIGGEWWHLLSTAAQAFGHNEREGLWITRASSPAPFTILALRVNQNHWGAFAQEQLEIADQLFLTAGIRLDRNRNFGDQNDAVFNPRVGISFVTDVGSAQVKFRGAYAESVLQPKRNDGFGFMCRDSVVDEYGEIGWCTFPPEDLKPGSQHGPEVGFEVYQGRSLFTVTFYDQTVNDWISRVLVDSVAPLSGSGPYLFRQRPSNFAEMSNKGLELQFKTGGGPLDFNITYSWMQSRLTELGLRPDIAQFSGFEEGDRIPDVPEQFGGASLTYRSGDTDVVLSGTYIGNRLTRGFRGLESVRRSSSRLPVESGLPDIPRWIELEAYVSADLNIQRQISPKVGVYLQIQNVFNNATGDEGLTLTSRPVMGRMSSIGTRIRLK